MLPINDLGFKGWTADSGPRTVEAELRCQCADHCTHTHRNSHRRAAIRSRGTRDRRRRRPRTAAAHIRRGKRGRRRWVDNDEAHPTYRDCAAAAWNGVGRNLAYDRSCTNNAMSHGNS